MAPVSLGSNVALIRVCQPIMFATYLSTYMPPTITSRITSGVVVTDVAGRLSFLDVTLRAHMNERLEEGHRAFVLNLAHVPYIDSFGLGQLVTILTSIRSKGGHLILVGLTDRVRMLFQITRLNTVFVISTEEADAVARLGTKTIEPVLQSLPAKSHLS